MAMRRRLRVKDRARRLVSVFLRRHREVTAVKEEVFDAAHLKQLMLSRRWEDAERYLDRFLPPLPLHETRSPVADKLFIDLGLIRVLAKIAAGGQEGSEAASIFRKIPRGPFASGVKTFIAQMKSDETRPNLLKVWDKVELERVDILMDMVSRCPELQGDHVTAPPRVPSLPWPWIPAQHRFRLGPTRCKNKAAGHTPSHVLARAFQGKKRLLSTKGSRKAKRVTIESSQGRTWDQL